MSQPRSPSPDPQSPPRWHYGAPGQVVIPHTAVTAAVVRLLPFVTWVAADATATTYRVTSARLRQAVRQGWSPDQLWALLAQHAGPLPPTWRAAISEPAAAVRIERGAVLLSDTPAVLDRAARARSVQRHLTTRLAPGIALVAEAQVAPLIRALDRQAIGVTVTPAPPAPVATALHPGDLATLLVACAFYRQYAPDHAPLLPTPELEDRLRTTLPIPLRQATEEALNTAPVRLPVLPEAMPWQPDPLPPPVARLVTVTPAASAPAPAASPPTGDGRWATGDGRRDTAYGLPATATAPPDTSITTPAAMRIALREAVAWRHAVEIVYLGRDATAATPRIVRPLDLYENLGSWYLRAYCTRRHAERTFRLDRIHHLTPLPATRRRRVNV